MPKATKSTPVIQLTKLTKQYGFGDATYNALDEVTLKIEKGEFIAIMGPSGCGKTTLLNVIGLLDRANDGDYLLDGKSVKRLSAKQQARVRSNQIGIVFQSFNLITRMTVLENVALPLTYKGVGRTKRLMRASEVLKTFHLSEREYYMPWQLSGGQMQRVAIARALVNEPSIILADEPTGNLDSRSSHVIMEELSELHKKGNTIIMVTHNPNLTSYASRVINMLDGKIASDTKIKVDTKDADSVVKIPLNRRQKEAEKLAAASPAAKRGKKPAPAKKSRSRKKESV
ncbi:MAG: ABC transporter ATP-binding protein [Acidobacteriota bacterium]